MLYVPFVFNWYAYLLSVLVLKIYYFYESTDFINDNEEMKQFNKI